VWLILLDLPTEGHGDYGYDYGYDDGGYSGYGYEDYGGYGYGGQSCVLLRVLF
jgi:hypothetical protein